MKYASLDLETTGLHPEKGHQILEIGIIVEDSLLRLPRSECPSFHSYLDWEAIVGDPFALAMNAEILKKICALRKSDPEKQLRSPTIASACVFNFLQTHFGGEPRSVTVAGKNIAGFDVPFLRELDGGVRVTKLFHHRVVDPAPLFVNFLTDDKMPDMKQCKERAGINGDVLHNALDDAWDVIELLRTKY